MAILIEKGVPLPAVKKRQRAPKYNFSGMEVLDSFAVPELVKNPKQLAARATSQSIIKRFEAREMEDGTFRIWRTA